MQVKLIPIGFVQTDQYEFAMKRGVGDPTHLPSMANSGDGTGIANIFLTVISGNINIK